MGHHGKVAPVRGAETGKSALGTVGIKGIVLGRRAVVINIDQRHQLLAGDLAADFFVREMKSSLAMVHMNTKDHIGHTGQHHGRAFLHLDRYPAGFKAAGTVMDKAGLAVGGKSLEWYPAQEGK